MKLKNINPLEQHVDRIVLGLAALFLLFVVWTYVVSNRFPGAGSIDDEVQAAAQRLEGELDKPADTALTQFRVPNYAEGFIADIGKPLTPPSPLAGVGADALADGAPSGFGLPLFKGEEPTDFERQYQPVQLAGPVEINTRADLVTLDAANPEVPQLFGQPPYDEQSVSVIARVDLDAIVEQTRPQQADLGERPTPETWLREMFVITDVQVERRHRLPNGDWSDPMLIDPMPGRLTMRGQLDTVNRQNALQYVDAIRTRQQAIIQPAAYAIKNGAWEPPLLTEPEAPAAAEDGGEATGPNADRIRTLQNEIKQYENALQNEQRKLERAQATTGGTPNPGLVRRAQANIQSYQQEIYKRRVELQRLGQTPDAANPAVPGGRTPGQPYGPGGYDGMDPSNFYGPEPGYGGYAGEYGGPGEFGMGYPGPGGGPGTPGYGAGRSVIQGSILNQPSVEVWTQDLSVQPGQTYQYRVRIVATNPLYGRPQLPESQADLRDKFTIAGDWSEWSAPVETPQLNYFWVVGGSKDVGYVKVELWRFHDGLWKQKEANIYPGDPIALHTASWEPLAGEQPPATPEGQEPGAFGAGGYDPGAYGPEYGGPGAYGPEYGGPGGYPPGYPQPAAAPTAAPGTPGAALPLATGPIDFVTGLTAVDIDFDHKLVRQVGNLAMTTSTVQLIYTDQGQNLLTRTTEHDRNAMETKKVDLLGEGAVLTREQKLQLLREKYAAERERRRQEALQNRENAPDRRIRTGDYGPGEYGGPGGEYGPEYYPPGPGY